MATRTWTCKRVSKGVVCGHRNSSRYRICRLCRKKRPAKKHPAHRQVLKDLTYEQFVTLNEGEFCWIHRRMGLPDPPRKTRLQRDHDHLTGKARGLLCYRCNRQIPSWITPKWLRAAADYLERADSL